MVYFSAVLVVLIIAVVWNFKSQLEKLKEQHEEELCSDERREIHAEEEEEMRARPTPI